MILRTSNIVSGAVTLAFMLGCSTLSLKVAGERKAVDDLRQQIDRDGAKIATLQAEVKTRARLPELQRWNDQVLRLSAPTARQFVGNPVQLAAFGEPAAPAAAETPRLAIAEAPIPAPPAVHTVAYNPAPARPRHVVTAALSLDDAVGSALDTAASAPAHLTQVVLR